MGVIINDQTSYQSQILIMKKNKALKLIIFSLLTFQVSLFCQVTNINDITIAIKNMDTKTIYESCENAISLSTPTANGKYSKTQARQILDQFFRTKPAVQVKAIKTQSELENNPFSIIKYQTQNNSYNIFIQFKKANSRFLIQTIQIQEIKTLNEH